MTYSGFWTSGLGVTTDRLNAGTIQYNTLANRPAAALVGVLFYATDFGIYYRDNGSSWDELSEDGLTVKKTADQAISSDASLNNDTHLVLAIPASQTWLYEITLIFASTGAADLRVGCTVPSGATGTISTFWQSADGTDTVWANELDGVISLYGNGQIMVIKIYFYVVNSTTAGNVQLQWAQYISNGATTTVYAGSKMSGRKLA